MPSNWPKTWLKRKQIQKPQGMENALVAAIALDFFFDRLQIREQVAVREHHAAGFCGGSRRKYNLHGIVAVKHRQGRSLPPRRTASPRSSRTMAGRGRSSEGRPRARY